MPARPYREPAPIEPDPVPPEAPERDRLGSLRSVHAPPPLYRSLPGPVLITALVVAVGAAGHAPLAILVALGSVTLAILAREPLRIRGCSTALHAHGLVLMRRGARRVVPFDDVNEVWFEIPLLHSQAGALLTALRLVEYSGEEHRVPLTVNEGFTLARGVVHGCSVPLLVEARRALGEGKVLTFGKIQLDRVGITLVDAQATWREIRLAVMSHGSMHFYRRFPLLTWRTVHLDRIPNPTVFIGLVAQCAAKAKIDDPLLMPLASEADLRSQVKEGGNELALRRMLVGGLFFIAGVTITWVTDSSQSGTHTSSRMAPSSSGLSASFRASERCGLDGVDDDRWPSEPQRPVYR